MFIEGLGLDYKESPMNGAERSFKKRLGREDFLNLLLTQLKHQDPLSPLESVEFTAQLAQFSSLEQMFQIKETLAEIQDSLRAQENRNILDYIGKVVQTNDNIFTVQGGKRDLVTYKLEDRADVTVFIYDEEGLEVRRIYEGWKDAGQHEITWNCRNNNGDLVGDGIYTFDVEARDEKGNIVPSHAYLAGRVTGVTYQNRLPYLMIGNDLVSPEKIVEVREKEETP